MQNDFEISGRIVDVVSRRIFKGTVRVANGKISEISEHPVSQEQYILPGLIDAHIHIESSMLIPSEFARLAVIHGTVATVSDPHEIANVLGIEGVRFMITNGQQVPFKFYFGAPSCVPATDFESSGARIGVPELEELLNMPEIHYLSEMMNYPGVIYSDKTVLDKIEVAKRHGKPVDGHAPGIRGNDIRKYISAGISTDHECFSLEEALEKISLGMHILVREGSAAKNMEDLSELLKLHPEKVMFCSDDRHPDDLAKRHVKDIVKRLIIKRYDPVEVLRCCCYNPVKHYKLDVGLLQVGDDADLIIVDDLDQFNVLSVFIRGEKVAENGKTLIPSKQVKPVNHFVANPITPEDLKVEPSGSYMRVIGAQDGQLITASQIVKVHSKGANITSDLKHDVLKMIVFNRYTTSRPAVAFIHGFGLKKGAIASSVAHDSHNIIAVGVTDEEIAKAVNMVIREKGGIAVTDGIVDQILPLPVGGIMSNNDGFKVAKAYETIDAMAKALGSALHAPFMTLSFMALLVIPALKLSDKGLFDGNNFKFTTLFLD